MITSSANIFYTDVLVDSEEPVPIYREFSVAILSIKMIIKPVYIKYADSFCERLRLYSGLLCTIMEYLCMTCINSIIPFFKGFFFL
jgi:hypothetical protein